MRILPTARICARINVQLNADNVRLAQREHIEVLDGRGTSMRCLRGSLWLTRHADARDIVLATGESFTLDRDGLAVISAGADSTLALSTEHR